MMSWPWLLQHLISVSVLVALVWLICLALKNRPAWRHALWLVVLIKLVTPAIVTWPWTVDEIAAYVRPETKAVSQEEQQRESSVSVPAPGPVEAERAPALPEIELTATDGLTEEIPPVFVEPVIVEDISVEPLVVSVPEMKEPVVDRSEITVPSRVAIPVERHSIVTADEPAVSAPLISSETVESGLNGLLGLWIIGSAVLLLVQLRRLLVRRAVIRRGEPPARELVAEIERVSRELNMKPVRATVVREIASPFLWCLGRPKLAWPSDMSDGETLQESRGIIAHELAHIRRRDHWVTWLELAAGVIWWWNPLFWFVRRHLRESSEMACDAVALSLYDERKTYAELFLKLSTNLQTGSAAPVLGVSTGHSASIERRITMIMSDCVTGRMSGWGILAVICFALVVLPSLSVGQDVPATEPEAVPAISEDEFAADAPGDETEESDPLRKKARQAIEFTRHRYLDASRHTPWQIMHGMLALRKSYQIKVDGETANALEWIRQGQSYNGEPWIEKTQYGGRFHTYTKPYHFEGHPNQFLAMLSMSDLPKDFTFATSEGPVSIAEMVEHAKMTVNDDEEPTWTLCGLSKYLPSNAYWHNARGEVWTIERLVEKQSRADFDKSACGGTLGLLALAHSRNQHIDQGRKLYGAWIEADRVIKQHIDVARDLQHPDGMFSCGYFAKRDYKEDFAERFSANGHTLEFLMMAVSDEELDEPWIRKGVEAVADDLIANRRQPVDCGPFYHAVHGLVLYLQRIGRSISESSTDQPTKPQLAANDKLKEYPETPPSFNTEPLVGPVPDPNVAAAKNARSLLPGNSRNATVGASEAAEEPTAQRNRWEELDGTWFLIKSNLDDSDEYRFLLRVFDIKDWSVTTIYKKKDARDPGVFDDDPGSDPSTKARKFAVDANRTPHHLTMYGNDSITQAIFEVSGNSLRIAYFPKAQWAIPKSFDDPRTDAGELTVMEFRRAGSVDETADVLAIQPDPDSLSGRDAVSLPRTSSTNPPAAHTPGAAPPTAKQSSNEAQITSSLDADLLGLQILPEINVSPDEEIQKLQRNWLEINVESAQAASESAKTTYEFRKRLNEKGAISSTELEQAQAELRQKELQLERAKLLLQMFDLQAKRQEKQWRHNKKQIDSLPTY